MSRFRFTYAWPPEMRAALEPLLERYAWILPRATWRVWVYHRYDGDEVPPAQTDTEDQYGVAKITFSSHWLDFDEGGREEMVMHEFFHVAVNPLADLCDDAIEVGARHHPRLAARLRADKKRAMERVVSDLTYTVAERAKEGRT